MNISQNALIGASGEVMSPCQSYRYAPSTPPASPWRFPAGASALLRESCGVVWLRPHAGSFAGFRSFGGGQWRRLRVLDHPPWQREEFIGQLLRALDGRDDESRSDMEVGVGFAEGADA